jgi:drug/metabolite transporter (DMT)-like permease
MPISLPQNHTRTPQKSDFSLLAILFSVFLCAVFGGNAVAIKYSFSGLGVFTTAGIRFTIASACLFVWARMTGHSLIFPRGQGRHLAIISLIFAAQMTLFYLGLDKSNASRGILLINLQPFFVLFLAHQLLQEERITKRKFLGILLGFSGVAFVFMEKGDMAADFRIGDLMLLAATLMWACNTIYMKKILRNVPPLQLVFYNFLITVPIFYLEAWLWDPEMIIGLNPKVLTALLYQSIITASFGFVAWNTLLSRYGAASLHSFLFVMPITGVILGGLILNEPLTPNIWIALLLIASGIMVVHIRFIS